MLDKINKLINEYRGKEQLVALKCYDIVKECKVLDEEEFINKVHKEAIIEMGCEVISVKKLINILDEMKNS